MDVFSKKNRPQENAGPVDLFELEFDADAVMVRQVRLHIFSMIALDDDRRIKYLLGADWHEGVATWRITEEDMVDETVGSATHKAIRAAGATERWPTSCRRINEPEP